MLVLSRKSKESILIGEADNGHELLRVIVLEIRGGTVKLGFEADKEVEVYREEVWQRVCAERQSPHPMPVVERPKQRVPYVD